MIWSGGFGSFLASKRLSILKFTLSCTVSMCLRISRRRSRWSISSTDTAPSSVPVTRAGQSEPTFWTIKGVAVVSDGQVTCNACGGGFELNNSCLIHYYQAQPWCSWLEAKCPNESCGFEHRVLLKPDEYQTWLDYFRENGFLFLEERYAPDELIHDYGALYNFPPPLEYELNLRHEKQISVLSWELENSTPAEMVEWMEGGKFYRSPKLPRRWTD